MQTASRHGHMWRLVNIYNSSHDVDQSMKRKTGQLNALQADGRGAARRTSAAGCGSGRRAGCASAAAAGGTLSLVFSSLRAEQFIATFLQRVRLAGLLAGARPAERQPLGPAPPHSPRQMIVAKLASRVPTACAGLAAAPPGGGATACRSLSLPAQHPPPVCSEMANKKRGRDDELPEGVQEALDSLSQTIDRESTEQKMRVRGGRWAQCKQPVAHFTSQACAPGRPLWCAGTSWWFPGPVVAGMPHTVAAHGRRNIHTHVLCRAEAARDGLSVVTHLPGPGAGDCTSGPSG